ncbi:MAG TPA: major capsid protein P2 [Sphingobium sp.]
MQKQVILDPFQNVVASGVAVCDMNKFLGQTLEKIVLDFAGSGALTRSMLTLIQLKANGKVIFETTGANIGSSNLYNGQTDDATKLKIDFMDRKAVTVNARQVGAIDLSQASGVANLRLEVTIAGATTPILSGVADVSPVSADPAEAGIRPLVCRRHRATVVIGAAGTFAIPVPHIDPAGGGSNYRRVYCFSANMTALKAVRDGVTEFELTKAQNQFNQVDNFKSPQASLVVFDPVQDGQLAGRTWDTRQGVVRSAQFYGTFSAGETITVETEELITLGMY